jgi:hypothetical protein
MKISKQYIKIRLVLRKPELCLIVISEALKKAIAQTERHPTGSSATFKSLFFSAQDG